MEYDLGASILRLGCSNHWRTHSRPKCYPCLKVRCVTYVSGPDPEKYGAPKETILELSSGDSFQIRHGRRLAVRGGADLPNAASM